MTKKTEIYSDKTTLAQAAMTKIIALSAESVADHGSFNIALAGGSTPRLLYELLSTQTNIDWPLWHVFFGDERFVPLDHPDSNFHMAYETLLSHVLIPKSQIHPVNTGATTAAIAAEDYDRVIQNVNFDLILLGLGSDGHTLSLFPGKPALKNTDKLVTSSTPGILPPPVDRITFTLLVPTHNAWFLVAGSDKAAKVKEILQNEPDETRPASLIQPKNGDTLWLLDQAAAQMLI